MTEGRVDSKIREESRGEGRGMEGRGGTQGRVMERSRKRKQRHRTSIETEDMKQTDGQKETRRKNGK